MKISFDYYDLKMTLEDRDDLTSTELLDLFIKSMTMLGYHQESIKRSVLELAEEYDLYTNEQVEKRSVFVVRQENSVSASYPRAFANIKKKPL